MFCTKCGVELRDVDRFCSQCGQITGVGMPPRTAGPVEGLSLPIEGKKIGGVCAGFARHMGVDVTLVRVVWLTAALLTGVGFIAYLVAWLLIPKDRLPAAVQPELVKQNG